MKKTIFAAGALLASFSISCTKQEIITNENPTAGMHAMTPAPEFQEYFGNNSDERASPYFILWSKCPGGELQQGGVPSCDNPQIDCFYKGGNCLPTATVYSSAGGASLGDAIETGNQGVFFEANTYTEVFPDLPYNENVQTLLASGDLAFIQAGAVDGERSDEENNGITYLLVKKEHLNYPISQLDNKVIVSVSVKK